MINKYIKAIKEAQNSGTLFNNDALKGYSGNILMGILQRFVRANEGNSTVYLEIGVFQGLTLLSVAKANKNTLCYGVDNFAFFDPEGKNKGLVEKRISELKINNAELINKDYEDTLLNLNQFIENKVSVYFVDGPHDYRSQLMCLEYMVPYLSENAVIVVDDSNYNHVRQANKDFLITHSEFKLLFEAYTPSHPHNMEPEEVDLAKSTYWNGINCIVRDPRDELESIYPDTIRDRSLFENDHIVHAAKEAIFAPEAVEIVRKFKRWNVFGALKDLLKIKLKDKSFGDADYSAMNTFSHDLPAYRFASSKSD